MYHNVFNFITVIFVSLSFLLFCCYCFCVVLASAVGYCYYYCCSYCIVFAGVASLLCSFQGFWISISLGLH